MLWHFPGLCCCVGCDSRAFGHHWVSSSLEKVMRVPLHVLVVLVFSLLFQASLPSPSFLMVLFIINPVSSLLFFQFSGKGRGAGAEFFWWVGLVVGLQGGQSLRCSSFLGLGLAVLAPMFLGIQPPYVTKALTIIINVKFHEILIAWK